MKTLNLRFRNCEHGGDLARFEDDVVAAGASVVEADVDLDAERGIITAEVEDKDYDTFLAKFKATRAYDFSNLNRY